MRRKPSTQSGISTMEIFIFLVVLALLGLLFVFLNRKQIFGIPPDSGVWPIKIIVLTTSKRGLHRAPIFLNGRKIGESDKFGTFVGTTSARRGDFIKLEVRHPRFPKLHQSRVSQTEFRKTLHGHVPAEIKWEVFFKAKPLPLLLPRPAPTTAPGRVSLRPLGIKGSLGRLEIAVAAASLDAKLEACVAGRPRGLGILHVEVIVDHKGRTIRFRDKGHRGLSAKVRGCLERVIRRVRYPRPAGGGIVVIRYLLRVR